MVWYVSWMTWVQTAHPPQTIYIFHSHGLPDVCVFLLIHIIFVLLDGPLAFKCHSLKDFKKANSNYILQSLQKLLKI